MEVTNQRKGEKVKYYKSVKPSFYVRDQYYASVDDILYYYDTTFRKWICLNSIVHANDILRDWIDRNRGREITRLDLVIEGISQFKV